MIKINFENRLEDDDRRLVYLLKQELKEDPSDQLVESTLNRLNDMRAERMLANRPLKKPLFMMGIVVALLFLPFFSPITLNNKNLIQLSELMTMPAIAILVFSVCCWLGVLAFQILKLIFPISFKIKLNTFKS